MTVFTGNIEWTLESAHKKTAAQGGRFS